MPRPVVRVREPAPQDADALGAGLAALRAELEVTPEFPAAAQAAAERAARQPRLPALDRTDIALLTLDPPGARDLDQALHIERTGSGYRVHYAIADVAAFVEPGGPVDEEAHRRGETLYGAGSKVPLHPPVLSEAAASLLPGEVRPALLWTVEVDDAGEGRSADVRRALVRSRAQLDYDGAQADLDAGRGDAVLGLLGEVGRLRLRREADRGGVSLPTPDQEVSRTADGWRLTYRRQSAVEQWNAQISLLTGMAAAWLMLRGGVGLLRTLPPAHPADLRRLRRTAAGLGVPWPDQTSYPDFVRSLDADRPEQAAMLVAATRLFRGAGYAAFDGTPPADTGHAALAGDYAHVTAPLRRLADRYAGQICVALCAGKAVPSWVLDRLDRLPARMQESARRANRYESGVLDLVEAILLRDRVGEAFPGVVVQADEKHPDRGRVVVQDPAVEAGVRLAPSSPRHELPVGTGVEVLLTVADPAERRVRFELP